VNEDLILELENALNQLKEEDLLDSDTFKIISNAIKELTQALKEDDMKSTYLKYDAVVWQLLDQVGISERTALLDNALHKVKQLLKLRGIKIYRF